MRFPVDLLNELYARLLSIGLLALREAIFLRDFDWAAKEVEFLHNIPSLIGEENVDRHRSFWEIERDLYKQWVAECGSERVQSRLKTYYEPVWREMEPVLLEAFSRETITPGELI
jgi:hypothetical protein